MNLALETETPPLKAAKNLGDRLGVNPIFRRFKLRFASFPILAVATLGSAGLFGITAWQTVSSYRQLEASERQNLRLEQLKGQIVYLDEWLTMSVRLAASTGDLGWEERYDRQLEPFAEAIDEAIALAPQASATTAELESTYARPILLEERAFELVRQRQSQEAWALLLGQEYEQNKQTYARYLNTILNEAELSIENQLQGHASRLQGWALFSGIALMLSLMVWVGIGLLYRSSIDRHHAARDSLQRHNRKLENLNRELKDETQQVLAREEAIRVQSEVLQEDMNQLLAIVSSLEEGNLTVRAEVQPQITGLVADVFNRIAESLSKTISVVLSTTQQVTYGAQEFEQLAIATVREVERQTQSVVRVQQLMSEMNALSEETAQEAAIAEQMVQQARTAVNRGEEELETMTSGIGTLQAGTEQIVRRTQTLTDFVDLATQFAKEQKRVAAQTRVLALNASMLASRASSQQDPDQFASIAREFETIAGQVNHLAVETNQNSIVLQQRSDRIQTVVSGLNRDVQDISHLVGEFSQGVGQSRQSFEDIRSYTEQVTQIGRQVTDSSQAIAAAARNTLQAIEEIAAVAAETERSAMLTRKQSGAMGAMAEHLLELMGFFKIAEDPDRSKDTASLIPDPDSKNGKPPSSSAMLMASPTSVASLEDVSPESDRAAE